MSTTVIDLIVAARQLLTKIWSATNHENESFLTHRNTHVISRRNLTLIRALTSLVDPKDRKEVSLDFIEELRGEEGSLEMSWVRLDQPDEPHLMAIENTK